ncbi:hypothetical protein KUCAC02_009420 [Chaenocephalus aceratus]|uniref:Uncharacterized protein n=1 Tax=Chaenocephalus aceratus TaxID=36190 RepID=A0ACB9WTG6_CHAAC|nr:hypothetical protein KUCAC02_009420 [Chaenocephalus aceratus]
MQNRSSCQYVSYTTQTLDQELASYYSRNLCYIIFGLLAEGNMTREDRVERSTRPRGQPGHRALRTVWKARKWHEATYYE